MLEARNDFETFFQTVFCEGNMMNRKLQKNLLKKDIPIVYSFYCYQISLRKWETVNVGLSVDV